MLGTLIPLDKALVLGTSGQGLGVRNPDTSGQGLGVRNPDTSAMD